MSTFQEMLEKVKIDTSQADEELGNAVRPTKSLWEFLVYDPDTKALYTTMTIALASLEVSSMTYHHLDEGERYTIPCTESIEQHNSDDTVEISCDEYTALCFEVKGVRPPKESLLFGDSREPEFVFRVYYRPYGGFSGLSSELR